MHIKQAKSHGMQLEAVMVLFETMQKWSAKAGTRSSYVAKNMRQKLHNTSRSSKQEVNMVVVRIFQPIGVLRIR